MPAVADQYFSQNRLIAILRGIKPNEVLAVGEAIFNAGWRCLEVPLNSPDPFESISRLVKRFGDTALIGAGTVLTAEDVEKVHKAGARLIVAPNTDADVVKAALARDMVMMPGVYTATEAFNAIKLGSKFLKIFPADSCGPGYIRALKSVLPTHIKVIPTGGIAVDTVASFHTAGCYAFGVGSSLYKPGTSADEVQKRAEALTAAVKDLK
jgi:2-dehydro-3-deoxyphosphogalactonate aldolase